MMDTKVQSVSGSEAFWGDVKPTPGQLDLVNKSPTLVSQIHEGDRRVATGENLPMAVKGDIPGDPDGKYDLQKRQLQFPPRLFGGDNDMALSTFAHEMGHLIYAPQDRAFKQKYVANVNPRDPGVYNATAMWPVRAEGEAEYNRWKVGSEIERNTATPGHPGTSINSDDPTMNAIASANANRPAGLTDKQNENRLIRTGMNSMATSGSHGADGTYDSYTRRITGAAPTEPGKMVSANYAGDDTTGDITSASQHWESGDVSTQNYKDGKLQSTRTVDPAGKPLQTSSYTYAPNGSYSVTVKNGNGRTIQQSNFNADRSGVERGFNPDGSRLETQFNGQNHTTQMTQYDSRGHETQKDRFDPGSGRDISQLVTHPDGSKTLYWFNARSSVGEQGDYDASGKPVATYEFDDSGRVASITRFNADGSRTVNTVGTNGTGTQVTVDKQGNRSAVQHVTYDQATQQSYDARSRLAATIAPPQPVGSHDALGGQTNYYDPANNRLTKQIVTNPDGSKTLKSFTDKNTLGTEVQYGPDGKPVSSTSYDPDSGLVNQRINYAADGSREDIRIHHDDHTISTTRYNAAGQITQTRTKAGDSEKIENYDPQSGRVITVETVSDVDGSRTVSSSNAYGHEGARETYDRTGRQTSSVRYRPDEGTGTLTYMTRNTDGSQQVDKIDRNRHAFYSVDRAGRVHDRRSIPLSTEDAGALAQWKAGWSTQR
ncbi:hypothetical protein V4C56_28640 [Paraburkholderia azotifigens]|uniref:RHS repeat protein n=2 Tax=Paraburkholderia azotifigens TaxID=2057004 RepID=A0ABU9R9V8_9BURK